MSLGNVDQRRLKPASAVDNGHRFIRPVVSGNGVVVDWQDSSVAARRRNVEVAGPRTDHAGSRHCRSAVAVTIYLAGCSATAVVLVMWNDWAALTHEPVVRDAPSCPSDP